MPGKQQLTPEQFMEMLFYKMEQNEARINGLIDSVARMEETMWHLIDAVEKLTSNPTPAVPNTALATQEVAGNVPHNKGTPPAPVQENSFEWDERDEEIPESIFGSNLRIPNR
jgi:hypothetical protein